MVHESDERTKEVLTEVECTRRLGNYGHPALGRLRMDLFADEEVPRCHLRWELIATSLYLANTPTHWGTQFGPAMSGVQSDGTRVDSPPLETIIPECVSYWQERMVQCQQPTLRAQYADLVWEFSFKVTGKRPPIEAARVAIDSYLESILDNRLEPPSRDDEAIDRLLTLCASIGDDARLQDACAKLIARTEAAESDEAKEWQQRDLFPLLLKIPKKKWPRNLLDNLAQALRQRLESIPLATGNQWSRRSIAIPLASYYWQTGRKEDAHATLRHYGEAVINEGATAKAMMAVGWLESLFQLYKQYEMHDDTKEVLRLMEARQPDLPGELIPMKNPIELKKEDVDQWLDSVMADTLGKTLHNLIDCFHPKLNEERQKLQQLENKFPMTAFFGACSSLLDHEGRTVARIEDENDKLVRQLTQNLQLSDIFIQFAFPELRRRFKLTTESLLQEISQSPVWSQERLPILSRALAAFFDDDPVVAIHLLVPEIEAAIRKLACGCGVLLQKPHRRGGYVLKNLDDLLREDAVVTTMTEDSAVYLRTVLTDQRGWNVRNNVCHGLTPAASLNMTVARRLMLIVFWLGIMWEQATDEVQIDCESEGYQSTQEELGR